MELRNVVSFQAIGADLDAAIAKTGGPLRRPLTEDDLMKGYRNAREHGRCVGCFAEIVAGATYCDGDRCSGDSSSYTPQGSDERISHVDEPVR